MSGSRGGSKGLEAPPDIEGFDGEIQRKGGGQNHVAFAERSDGIDGKERPAGPAPRRRIRCQSYDAVNEALDEDMDADESTKFANVLEDAFPRAVPEHIFIEHVSSVLYLHGFTPETSINLVSTCRDELCRPFTELLDTRWGDSFNISSLGGFVFCGRTGFKAAMAHAPVVDGMERYVFWVAPHIALSSDGTVGKCYRLGREQSSSACGALLAVLKEIQSGTLSLKLDSTDLEQSLLKQGLVSHLPYGHVPTLVELTYAAYECILKEIEETASAAIDPSMCEFIVVGGIQIHGPLGQNFFWPGTMYKMLKGGTERVDLYEEYASAVSNWHYELKGWSTSEALALLQTRRREARLAAKEGDLVELKRAALDLSTVHDNHQRTLLHVAAMFGQKEVAEYLIQNFPRMLEAVDIDHHTAMDYAVERKNDDVAELLHEAGSGIDGETLRYGLMAAVANLDLEEFGRYVRFARNKEDALRATDKDGRSLVHICVGIKDQERDRALRQEQLINNLLGMGAEADTVDFFGRNSLHNMKDDCRKSTELLRNAKSRCSQDKVRPSPAAKGDS